MRWRRSETGGYILPATIMLGLAISVASTTFLQYTASTSESLNNQSYSTYAQEAAKAGVIYANSCIQGGNANWSQLTPSTPCDGSASSGSDYVAVSPQGDWRSTFRVATPTTAGGFGSSEKQAVSTGIVEILQNGSTVKRIYATRINDFQVTATIRKPSKGLSLTALRADSQDCAIANGVLYCWGDNSNAQIGDGTNTSRDVPTAIGVGGASTAFLGKVVTEVSTSNENTCAIADGEGYCWGDNAYGQIGDGTTTARKVPTHIAGPLGVGKKITNLTIAPTNVPYISDVSYQHACALSNGVPYCWGSNGYTQLTDQPGCSACNCGTCQSSVPVVTYGYNLVTDNPVFPKGSKVSRIAASSHDTCMVANGHAYCWGVKAPIDAACTLPPFGWAVYTGNPSGFNCDALTGNTEYSNGYDPHNDPSSSALNGMIVDTNSWQMSGDLMCTMASKVATANSSKYICFGKTPAVSWAWGAAYNPATVIPGLTNPDITDNDNGESPDLFFTLVPPFFVPGFNGSIKGYMCVVDTGIPKCANLAENYSGTNGGSGLQRLTDTTGSPAIPGLTTTKIGAGSHSVCVIANGQLFCFGDSTNGELANNSTAASAKLKLSGHTGTGGGTDIGTYGVSLTTDPTNYTFAASGEISVGGGHACAIVNGDVYCWGKNDSGQDGSGDLTEVNVPTTPPTTSGTVATKVSAGSNHTCAISQSQLSCWGLNTSGQLGMGNTTSPVKIPTLVPFFVGKHVTDVSAGDTGTCAIADGQAYCWGANASGEAGVGIGLQSTPVAVSGIAASSGNVATSITMGYRHACAVVNGDAYCWGSNNNCALAIVVLGSCPSSPYTSAQKITTGAIAGSYNNLTSNAVTAISAGNDFTCAIVNNSVACWGLNSSGQTGSNTPASTTTVSAPAFIKNSSNVVLTQQATTISAGGTHACATLQGVIYCWGGNSNGQLGNNDATLANKIYPVAVTGGDTNCNGTTCGGDTTSGTVQVTTNVAVGLTSSCSVTNAKILCWGDTTRSRAGSAQAGNLLVPTGTSNYIYESPYYKGPIF